MEMPSPCELELGPVSLDEIEHKLFLGGQSAARNSELLQKNRITHVLTIDIRPLPPTIVHQNHLTTKYLQLLDLPSEDLLSHLDDTFDFIEKGQQNGAVLVHCYFGVSRSASIVIGYLMKKYKTTYDQAFQMVKEKRNIIFPNEGFIAQLKLYRTMGYKIDKNSLHHKLHRLHIAADSVRRLKILSKEFIKLIQPDPSNEKHTNNTNLCRCKKCKRLLATEFNVLPHKDNEHICDKTYFLEPMAWMNVVRTDRGRLFCPKCSNDIGSFNWVVGGICPCGFHTTPAFCVNSNKVEFGKQIANMNKLQ